MALLTHTAQVLQQMSILLKCCPSEEVALQEWSPLPQSMLSPLAMSFAGDVLVAEVKQALEVWITSMHSYMANPIRNRILRCNWLPEWTLTVSRNKRVLFLCNKSFIDQPCRLDKHAKKRELVQYPAILTSRVVTHIYWVSSWVLSWHLISCLKLILGCVTSFVMCVFRFLWRMYLSQFQGSVQTVQQITKDVRPYAAASDHVLNNTNRNDSTAFVASW